MTVKAVRNILLLFVMGAGLLWLGVGKTAAQSCGRGITQNIVGCDPDKNCAPIPGKAVEYNCVLKNGVCSGWVETDFCLLDGGVCDFQQKTHYVWIPCEYSLSPTPAHGCTEPPPPTDLVVDWGSPFTGQVRAAWTPGTPGTPRPQAFAVTTVFGGEAGKL